MQIADPRRWFAADRTSHVFGLALQDHERQPKHQQMRHVFSYGNAIVLLMMAHDEYGSMDRSFSLLSKLVFVLFCVVQEHNV